MRRDWRIEGREVAGVRRAITWLHARAKEMHDPHARVILNTTAFKLGIDLSFWNRPADSEDGKLTLPSGQPGNDQGVSDAEKIARLRAELLHDKTCWYGAKLCSHPEARAKRDIARLLQEPFRHTELEAEEATFVKASLGSAMNHSPPQPGGKP